MGLVKLHQLMILFLKRWLAMQSGKYKMGVQVVVFDFHDIRFIRLMVYGLTGSTKVIKFYKANNFL
jgi:hypothetical protein